MTEELPKGKTRRGAVNQIMPGLYQRGHFLTWPAARKDDMLRRHGIQMVVNLWTKVDPDMSSTETDRIYLHWPIEGSVVPQGWQVIVKFIATWMRAGRGVLIHCEAGRNRSVWLSALVVRELMGGSGEHALAVALEANPSAHLRDALRTHLEGLT